MGGERASTVRQRERGLICALCGQFLCTLVEANDQKLPHRERRCNDCDPNGPRHRIMMNFMHRGQSWRVSFLEADCRTSLRKTLIFANEEKILDLARRGGGDFTSAARADMQRGIETGRGGIWLHLTKGQYRKLK